MNINLGKKKEEGAKLDDEVTVDYKLTHTHKDPCHGTWRIDL